MPQHDENIDAFWDIGNILPRRSPQKMRPGHLAPEPVTVSVSEEGPAENGFRIPARRAEPLQKAQTIREFCPDSGLIQKVKINPWPADFRFYTKFRYDALRYFGRSHPECEYVYFFSYMPQYDQMDSAQTAYYLYFRDEVRKEHYIKTDNSYLFLYIYEIINLPDKIPPAEGALLLSKLWGAYRQNYRYLDKYIGEWLCDYCLIYGVMPDWKIIGEFAGEIAGKVTLPEFYLTNGELSFSLIRSLSAYDFRKSKYYAEHKDAFETHIPKAAAYVLNRFVSPAPEAFGVHPVRVSRDSFSGAVACRDVKFKIELVLFPLKRSYEMKQLTTGVIKLCENQLRAAFSIKSRFSPTGVDERLKQAISDYFDGIYPDRFVSRRKKTEEDEAAAYLALYEPENKGPADITRALEIERDAWDTAELLGGAGGEDILQTAREASTPAVPVLSWDDGPSGDFISFLKTLSLPQRQAIFAAAKGEFTVFCRASGVMPEMFKGAINETAAEHIGDEVIDSDFTLIDEYEEELLGALSEFLEDTE